MSWLKKIFSPANIGTVGGFLLGGPVGAGVGRSLGGAVGNAASGKKITAGGVLKDFGTGLGAGYVGGALPGVGGLAGRYGSNVTVGSLLGKAGIGGGAGGVGNPLTGLSTADKWGLGLGALGVAGDAYGAYQEGKASDQDFGEDVRRWDLDFGEDVRRFDLDRADIDYERDLMNRKAGALAPMLGRYLRVGAA